MVTALKLCILSLTYGVMLYFIEKGNHDKNAGGFRWMAKIIT